VTAAQPTAAGSVPAQPAAAALLGGPDGAPAGAALPSEDGGGGGAGLSEAARAALPAMIRQYAQACAAEAEADSNAGGGGDGAAGGMAAADAAVPADAPPGLRPVLELLRLGASLLPAVLAALGEPAAKSGDGPALAAAAGALAAAAAVLAAPQLRGAVLEVEADVQRLLDSVGQVRRTITFSRFQPIFTAIVHMFQQVCQDLRSGPNALTNEGDVGAHPAFQSLDTPVRHVEVAMWNK